jgi:hypothetical protein
MAYYRISNRGGQILSERKNQKQLDQNSYYKYNFKVILEALGWFVFMLMMTTVLITFG